VSLAVTLIIIGLVIGFLAFCFAALNMFRGVTSPSFSFGGMIAGHLGAMVVMAFGGLLFAVGVILGIINALNLIR